MTVSCLAGLHDAFRPMVIEGLARSVDYGVSVEFDDDGCYRSLEDQSALYQKFLSGGPRAAPPGQSAHNYGLAVDIHVLVNGVARWQGEDFERAKDAFSQAGCLFLPPQYEDPGHCEHPQWRTLAGLGNNPVTNPTPSPPLPGGSNRPVPVRAPDSGPPVPCT